MNHSTCPENVLWICKRQNQVCYHKVGCDSVCTLMNFSVSCSVKTGHQVIVVVKVESLMIYSHLLLNELLLDYLEELIREALALKYASVHFLLCQPILYLDLKWSLITIFPFNFVKYLTSSRFSIFITPIQKTRVIMFRIESPRSSATTVSCTSSS